MLNGDGLRVVLWVAGCNHCCKECQNPITWDPDGGLLFDEAAKQEIFEQLEKPYISGITFCTVTDKYFVDCDVNTACIVIVLYDRTTQKLITKVRCIALKCLLHAHLGYCFMQTVDDCRCEWLGYITDTKTDDLLVRICRLIRTYFLADG